MSTQQRMPDPFGMKGGNLFEYWLSFFPVAPYFGVEWRMAPFFAPLNEMTKAAERNIDASLSVAGSRLDKAVTKKKVVAVGDMPGVAKEVAKAAPKPAPVLEAVADVMTPEANAPKMAAPKAAPAKKGGKPSALLAAKPASVDDLKMIKGIGPKLEAELNGLGVYTFEQMAGFGESDLKWIDDHLTAFKGRCFRDDWTGQAKNLLS